MYQFLQLRHEQQCTQQSTTSYMGQTNCKKSVSLQRTFFDRSSSPPSFFACIISETTECQTLGTTLLQFICIKQNHSVLAILIMLQKPHTLVPFNADD